ncbi:hypothetical protein [Flagellimonas lutaonensis]|uniref:Uncharacterized protein n=1 Tax=Flagellimonas lutaonensis TaxID=516051 RepID=A0A0D5YPJ9_9FLAO|nr:hypothetical protein [Allomuricauda lutaonensis]AKA33766.1 hypothetical protein VC82_74 [Allomuricauda lutaonensis]
MSDLNISKMKKWIKGALLFAILGTILLGCKKDDGVDGGTLGGSFTLDGTTYILDKGFIIDKGGEYYIILTSTGISATPGGGDAFVGKGDLVSLALISSSPNSFEPGTFTYDSTKSKIPGTIENVGAAFDTVFDTETDIDDFNLEVTEGTASVSLSEDIYTVTFNITVSTSSYEGSFSGMLTELID